MSSLRFGRPSSFLITKGALVQATYATFAGWDLTRPVGENTRRLRTTNYIGAPSNGWLKNFAKVITRRFDPQGADRPLVELAKAGCDLEIWKPLLLWHTKKTAVLTLPKPRVLSARVDHERSRMWDIKRGWLVLGDERAKYVYQSGFLHAQRLVEQVAGQDEWIDKARQQTEAILKGFYAALGWTVEINWKDHAPGTASR